MFSSKATPRPRATGPNAGDEAPAIAPAATEEPEVTGFGELEPRP